MPMVTYLPVHTQKINYHITQPWPRFPAFNPIVIHVYKFLHPDYHTFISQHSCVVSLQFTTIQSLRSKVVQVHFLIILIYMYIF